MDLDTLLRDTAFVADPTPRQLVACRAALDAATMISAQRVVVVRRMKRRALSLAAILAAAGSLVLVIGPMLNPGPSPTSAIPTVEPSRSTPAASPTADPVQDSQPVTLNLSLVLFHAARAAGAQQGGWPDAAYWHTVSSYHQGTTQLCGERAGWVTRPPASWRIPAPAAPGRWTLETSAVSPGISSTRCPPTPGRWKPSCGPPASTAARTTTPSCSASSARCWRRAQLRPPYERPCGRSPHASPA
jgi:hypothetical protein